MIVDILKWNPIHSNNFSAGIKPCVYIKPSIQLLDIFNRAPLHKVLVRVLDTKSKYDNLITFGILDKSSDVPNKRDNLFDCNGLYVVTLGGLDWQGYPEENGQIEFLEGIIEKTIKYLNSNIETTETIEKFEDPTKSGTTPSVTPESRTNSPPTLTNPPKKHGMSTKLLIVLGLLFLSVIIFTILTNQSESKAKHH
jgi:hypothetical protein